MTLKVCCPVSSYVETPSSKLIDNKVEDFSRHPNFKLLPQDLKCGLIRLTGRIIGGENAVPGQFPFIARISLSEISGIY